MEETVKSQEVNIDIESSEPIENDIKTDEKAGGELPPAPEVENDTLAARFEAQRDKYKKEIDAVTEKLSATEKALAEAQTAQERADKAEFMLKHKLPFEVENLLHGRKEDWETQLAALSKLGAGNYVPDPEPNKEKQSKDAVSEVWD